MGSGKAEGIGGAGVWPGQVRGCVRRELHWRRDGERRRRRMKPASLLDSGRESGVFRHCHSPSASKPSLLKVESI